MHLSPYTICGIIFFVVSLNNLQKEDGDRELIKTEAASKLNSPDVPETTVLPDSAATHIIVWCSDSRIQEYADSWVHTGLKLRYGDYDRIIVPGGAGGNYVTADRRGRIQEIDDMVGIILTLVKEHPITHVILTCHVACAVKGNETFMAQVGDHVKKLSTCAVELFIFEPDADGHWTPREVR